MEPGCGFEQTVRAGVGLDKVTGAQILKRALHELLRQLVARSAPSSADAGFLWPPARKLAVVANVVPIPSGPADVWWVRAGPTRVTCSHC